MALKDFRNFFSEFVALVGAGVATAALVLITALSDLTPPWPDAVVQLTAILQLVLLMLVYQFNKRTSKKKINAKLKLFVAAAGISCLAYLSAFSLFVYDLPDGTRDIRGLSCTADALLIYAESCPLLSMDQIADAGFIPDKLWTKAGKLFARLLLFSTWIAFFGFLVSVFATFIIYQRRV